MANSTESNVNFSIDAIENITASVSNWEKAKASATASKEAAETHNLDMYSEVMAVVNTCKFNSKGNLYKDDRQAIKGAIDAALGTGKGRAAKGKRLYENSVGFVRHCNKHKDTYSFPTQATASAVLQHMIELEVTTESGIKNFFTPKPDLTEEEKMANKIFGYTDKDGKWVNGFDAEQLERFFDLERERMAARAAAEEAAKAAEHQAGIDNDTVNSVMGALDAA